MEAAKRSYTRLDFSVEQEEKLIEFVKENPALYDPSNEHYKNRTYRDRLWTEFGITIGGKTGMCNVIYKTFLDAKLNIEKLFWEYTNVFNFLFRS